MAHIQNEENSSKEVDFNAQTEDGEIKNPTIKAQKMKIQITICKVK